MLQADFFWESMVGALTCGLQCVGHKDLQNSWGEQKAQKHKLSHIKSIQKSTELKLGLLFFLQVEE